MRNIVAIIIITIILVSSNAVFCIETWQGKVSFISPPTWKLIKDDATDKASVKLYLLREDEIAGENLYSNALLQFYPVPESITIDDSDGIVGSRFKGATKILQAKDGYWKTYLFVYWEGNQQYVALNRIGIKDEVGVELLLSFPVLKGQESEPLSVLTLNEQYVQDKKNFGVYCYKSMVEDLLASFNAACQSLKISEKGEYNANAVIIAPPTEGVTIYRYEGSEDSK